MEQFFQWFFDGLGTFLVGLVLGGGAGSAIAYRIATKSITRQSLSFTDNSKKADDSKTVNKRVKIKNGSFVGRDNSGSNHK